MTICGLAASRPQRQVTPDAASDVASAILLAITTGAAHVLVADPPCEFDPSSIGAVRSNSVV